MIDGSHLPPKPAIILPRAPEIIRPEAPHYVVPSMLMGGLGVKTLGGKGRGAAAAALSNARSLTFTAASSQYLSRSWGTGGNRKTGTISVFAKNASTGVNMDICSGGAGDSSSDIEFGFRSTNKFRIQTAAVDVALLTTATYSDTASFHHLVFAWDTRQATASDRVKLWYDGTQVTAFDTATYPALNADLPWGINGPHWISGLNYASINYFNGLMDEFAFIEGLQLTPASFADGSNKPLDLSGLTFGTKGFWLRFENNASTTTLGSDSSSNNWTLNAMTTGNSSTTVP